MTQPILDKTAVRELIRRELPRLVREDPEIHDLVVELRRKYLADRDQTEGRIERMLDELRRDGERRNREWEKQQAENKRKWEENTRKRPPEN